MKKNHGNREQLKMIANFKKKFIIHLFICAYIVWVISTPASLTLSLPPSLPGRTCSALISNFVEEKT
jgi:hypothetical protein